MEVPKNIWSHKDNRAQLNGGYEKQQLQRNECKLCQAKRRFGEESTLWGVVWKTAVAETSIEGPQGGGETGSMHSVRKLSSVELEDPQQQRQEG